MPDPKAVFAALIGAGLGAALLLLLIAVRGTVDDPTRPPSRIQELIHQPRAPLFGVRVAAGVIVAVLVLMLTRWPVAAIGVGAAVVCWPMLVGGTAEERRQTAQLEAVVTWCEALRDTALGSATLEQAIPATAQMAAPAIRDALLRLTGRIWSKVPLEQALQDFAEDLDHSADLIVAALQMNVRTRGDGLIGVLTNLAISAREELDLRRRVTASRAGDRRAMKVMMIIVAAVATVLCLLSNNFTAPYRTVAGQFVLAIVLGLFAASFLTIRKLASAQTATAFLPSGDAVVDPMEQRIVAGLTVAATAPADLRRSR